MRSDYEIREELRDDKHYSHYRFCRILDRMGRASWNQNKREFELECKKLEHEEIKPLRDKIKEQL